MTDGGSASTGSGGATEIHSSRLEAAVKTMAQGLCMFDVDQKLVICNEQYAQIYELPSELLIPGTLHDDIIAYRLAHGMQWLGGAEAFLKRNDARLASLETGVETVELRNGRVVQVRHQPMKNGGWVATHTDITDLRNRENELKLQNLRFDAAISNMSQGLSMFDRDWKLVVSNVRYAQIYRLPSELLSPGTPFEDILSHLRNRRDGDTARAEGCVRALTNLANSNTSGCEIVETDGATISILNRPMADGGWVSTHEDITEQRRNEARIRHLAGHDALTDLPNRTQFQEQITQLTKHIARGEKIAVLYVDLDHFKSVNDTLGHAVGDEVLRAAGTRLLTCCRKTDFVARLGGDEFAVLQGPLQHVEEPGALARRIVDAVREPFEIQGHRIVIGASVGIAVAPDDGTDANTVLKNADLALYRAKNEGRNTYHFYEEGMDIALQNRARSGNLHRTISGVSA